MGRDLYPFPVTRDEVLEALASHLQAEWGKLLAIRAARRIRHAAGNGWAVEIVVPAREGDIKLGELEIDEETGAIEHPLELKTIVDAIRREVASADVEPPEAVDPFGDVTDEVKGLLDLDDSEEEAPHSTVEGTPQEIYARAQSLLQAGDIASLQKARTIMPRLLSEPEKRGAVLIWMAVIERKLEQVPLAIGYLEAAAREFADRFDLSALEKAGAIALDMMGEEIFLKSTISHLVQQCRERMHPVANMFESPQFFAATEDQRDFLGDNTEVRTLRVGDTLVKEGQPSRTVFIVKSGLIGVYLEKPEGGDRLVRCCYPGWLLGESSVLVDGDPRATASLRAERPTEVWAFDAKTLRQVMDENENLRHRLAATKQIHRIDNFFSMHETIRQLDVAVRDDLLGCIQRVQTFETDSVIIEAGKEPDVACLVAKGEIAIFAGAITGEPALVLGADRFVGVRDAMHAIAPATTAVARAGSTVALIHAGLLRTLAQASPEHVVAVLERLG